MNSQIMSPQVEQFVREIRQKLPSHGSPESAAGAYRQSIALKPITQPIPPGMIH